jgi:hypothetical protein
MWRKNDVFNTINALVFGAGIGSVVYVVIHFVLKFW